MRDALTTLADLAGVALVVAGIALVSVPTALVALGAAVLLGSWRVSR